MDIADLKNRVRAELKARGFGMIGFASPPIGEFGEKFQEWIQQGYQGEMHYLARRQEERVHPEKILPEIRSVIVVGHSYDPGGDNTQDPDLGHISRYAWGQDYHSILSKKLAAFQDWLSRQASALRSYLSVDAQPVLEKSWAARAGMGWMGKHTNMIHEAQGSYFFLATILTNIPFEPDPPQEDHCGTCTRCLEVCPTGAIIAPYVLDARLCISYLTIELKGPVPRELRPHVGNHVFGCDDCQEVCPWNRFSQVTEEKSFFPSSEIKNQPLEKLLAIGPTEFKRRFRDSAISRAKWKGFQRNILVAMGNSGNRKFVPWIKEKLTEPEPLIRGHAVWAYHQLLGKAAAPVLKKMLAEERDGFVREEIQFTL